ncbi:MAG: ATP-dependent chaperone ClpB, partial [Rhizobiaceae bacterium]|nr:ATP-dependent chaperone ClpB [Rhizobiaceae bacterium]
MNIQKYSERVRGFLQNAQSYALGEGNPQFTAEHVLKALLDDEEGMAASLISRAGGDPRIAKNANDEAIRKLPKSTGGNGQLSLAQPLARVFNGAEEAAKKAGDAFVTVERLLVALAIESTASTAEALKKAGVTPVALNQVINEIRKGRTADTANAEQGFDSLKKYARDLTEEAREGKLDPVIGRDDEIR